MKHWSFYIAFLSFNDFLLGFHYRKQEVLKDEEVVEVDIHELGIGFLSIGIEHYRD